MRYDLRSIGKLLGKWIFAALFIVAGVGHFRSTESFVKIMPPYVPMHREVVLLSGVIEIVLGALLLIPATSSVAAWGLIALLVAVFPANIYMYHHRELFPIAPWVLLLRLPLQVVLIIWAYAYAKRKN